MEENKKTNEKKIGFFKRVWHACKDFEKYQDFAIEPLARAIGYIFKLLCIFAIIIGITITYKFSTMFQQGFSYMKEEMPELIFQDAILTVDSEEPIVLEDGSENSNIIIIDTKEGLPDETQEEYSKRIGLYNNGIILLKDRLIIKTMASNIQNTIMYTNLVEENNIGDFTKQDIINYFNTENILKIYGMFCFVIIIYLFIIYGFSTLIDALILSVLGFLTSRIVKIKIKYSSIYSMCVYALTLPIILNTIYMVVNILTGFVIQYFTIMYTTISYIIIVTSILMIKSDLIKRQQELMKIISEQEKVKQEMEEQERKRKEQEEKEEVKKKDKEQNKKEKSSPKGEKEVGAEG